MLAHKRQLQKSRRLVRKPRRYELVIQQVRNDINLRKEGFFILDARERIFGLYGIL